MLQTHQQHVAGLVFGQLAHPIERLQHHQGIGQLLRVNPQPRQQSIGVQPSFWLGSGRRSYL